MLWCMVCIVYGMYGVWYVFCMVLVCMVYGMYCVWYVWRMVLVCMVCCMYCVCIVVYNRMVRNVMA